MTIDEATRPPKLPGFVFYSNFLEKNHASLVDREESPVWTLDTLLDHVSARLDVPRGALWVEPVLDNPFVSWRVYVLEVYRAPVDAMRQRVREGLARYGVVVPSLEEEDV